MGLYDDIIDDLTEAFDADLADAVVNVTVTKYKRGTYDPQTGGVNAEILNVQQTRGIYSDNWKYEVYNTPIEPVDETFLLLASEIDFEPDVGTIIESTERGLSRVVEVRKDPVNATYELGLRY